MKRAPVFYVSLCIVLGIVTALYLSGLRAVIIDSIGLLIIRCIEKKLPKIWLVLCMFVFALGTIRGSWYGKMIAAQESAYTGNFNHLLSFEAEILEPPEVNGNNQKLVVSHIRLIKENRRDLLPGNIIVKTPTHPAFSYGDKILLTGSLKEPQIFDGFDYKEYLKEQQIYAVMDYPKIASMGDGAGNIVISKLTEFKSLLQEEIRSYLPEPHASLLTGILLGIKGGFDEDFSNNLKRAGVMHIIVVSGTNISIILMLLMSLAPHFGRKNTIRISLLLIIFYTIMVGSNPPAMRALLMGSLMIVATLMGRRSAMINTLFISAAMMLLINPLLFRSVSFQLSFLATMGILLCNGLFEKMLVFLPPIFKESLATTLSAQILITPILISSFGQVSLISPLTNLLLLPFVTVLTVSGIVFIAVVFLIPLLAGAWSCILYVVLEFFVIVIHTFGSLPFSSAAVGHVFPGAYMLLYGAVGIIYLMMKGLIKTKQDETYV